MKVFQSFKKKEFKPIKNLKGGAWGSPPTFPLSYLQLISLPCHFIQTFSINEKKNRDYTLNEEGLMLNLRKYLFKSFE